MRLQRHLWVCAAMIAMSTMSILRAESLQSARVTHIIREVQLMSGAAVRPAAVSDEVGSSSAVRTGDESRAELTFRDLTITRLGANTIFSFNEGARELTLNRGAILVSIPRNSPAIKVSTAAVSAGITGGTAAMNANAGAPTKLFVFEGHGTLCSKKTGECQTAAGGEFVMAMPNGDITTPEEFNAQVLYASSALVADFSVLPNADLIQEVIARQQGGGQYTATWPPIPPYQYIDMSDTIDQAFAGLLPVNLPTLPPFSLTTVTFNAAAGNWSSAANWKPTVVPNNSPGKNFIAILSSGAVTQDIAAGVKLQQFRMSGGTLVLSNPITLTNGFQYSGGSIGATSTLSIFGTSTQSVTLMQDGPTINNHGVYNVTFDNADVFMGAGTFNNSGTFNKTTGPNEDTILTPFNNSGTVSVLNGGLAFAGGGTSKGGAFTVASGMFIDFNHDYVFTGGTQFIGSDGNINFNQGTNMMLSGSITNASFVNAIGTAQPVNLILTGDTTWSGGGTLLLQGMVNAQGSGTFTNSSRIIGDTNSGSFGNGAIGIFNQAGGLIEANNNASVLDLKPSSLGLTNAGILRASNDGILLLDGSGGGSFSNTGTIETTSAGSLQFTGPVTSSGIVDLGTSGGLTITGAGTFTQTAGTFRMRGGTVTSSSELAFQGGIVDAHGTINAPTIQNSATIQPALGGNGLAIKSNVTLLNSSVLSFQLGGLTAGSQYSFLNVNGTVALGGKLIVSFANGFQNSVNGSDTFTIAASTANFTGSFTNVASGMRLETSDNVGSFVVDYGNNTITLSSFKLGPVHSGAASANVAMTTAKTRGTSIKISNTGELLALLEAATPNANGKITIRPRAAAQNNHKTRAQPNRADSHTARRLLQSRSSLALAREGQRHR